MLPTAADTTEIPLDKSRLRLYLAGALLFVALGAWFVARPDDLQHNPFTRDPRLIQALGAACVALFGALGFLTVKQLGSTAPGLVLTPEGFTDNSSGTAAGHVAWADVLAIRESDIMGQKLLAIVLRDPAAFIARQPSALKRRLMTSNLSSFSSPVQVSAGALRCTSDELKAAMQARLAAWQARG